MYRPVTVTQGPWNVSVTTGSHLPGAILSVFRHVGRFQFAYGDANNKVFRTDQDAWDYALTHGYIQVYRKGWCPRCRVQHWFCGARTWACAAHSHPYPGCEEAQKDFDKQDRTWRDRRNLRRLAAGGQ